MSLYRMFLIVAMIAWSVASGAETFGRFAYVASKADDTVQIFALHQASGRLVHRGYVPAGNEPYGVATDPSGKYVFAVNRASGSISVFSINQNTGALTEVPGSPFATGLLPYSVVVHPSGGFVYVANQGASTISAFEVDDATGALSAVAGSPFATPAGPIFLALSPSGNSLYSANYSNNSVSRFAVDGVTGGLAWAWNTTVGSNPSALAVHQDAQNTYLIVANSGSGSVSAFDLDSNGDIVQELQNSPFPTGTNPNSLALATTGYYSMVYVANYGSANITGILIHPLYKSLSAIDNSPFSTGTNPYSITTDPTGRYIYVSCPGSNEVRAYRIHFNLLHLEPVSQVRTRPQPLGIAFQKAPTALSFQSNRGLVTHRFEASVTSLRRNGDLWNAVETVGASDSTTAAVFHPSNQYAFHATNDSQVVQYSVNTDSTLSMIGSDSVGQDPKAIAIDPTGRFAYAAEFNGGITRFSIDAQGAFVPQSSYAYNAGTGITIDPNGKFLYLTRGGGVNQVTAFQVNAATGALSFVQAVAAGTTPTRPAVDPSGRFLYCANYGSGTLSVFSVNSSTGALTPVSTPAAPNAVSTLAVSLKGDFLYAAGTDMWRYSVDPATGALTYVDQIVGADSAVDMEVDFSGRYLYLLLLSGQIQMFDLADGAPVLRNTTDLGFTNPTSLAISRETVPTLFYDDFEDRDIEGWTAKSSWGVGGDPGALMVASSKGKIFAQFPACDVCTFVTEFSSIAVNTRASMLAWYRNGSNYVEVRLSEDKDSLLFKERVDAITVSKAKVLLPVDPGQTYILKVSYDGANYQVYVNERQVLNIPAKSFPSGAVGYKLKSVDGSEASDRIESVEVY